MYVLSHTHMHINCSKCVSIVCCNADKLICGIMETNCFAKYHSIYCVIEFTGSWSCGSPVVQEIWFQLENW